MMEGVAQVHLYFYQRSRLFIVTNLSSQIDGVWRIFCVLWGDGVGGVQLKFVRVTTMIIEKKCGDSNEHMAARENCVR